MEKYLTTPKNESFPIMSFHAVALASFSRTEVFKHPCSEKLNHKSLKVAFTDSACSSNPSVRISCLAPTPQISVLSDESSRPAVIGHAGSFGSYPGSAEAIKDILVSVLNASGLKPSLVLEQSTMQGAEHLDSDVEQWEESSAGDSHDDSDSDSVHHSAAWTQTDIRFTRPRACWNNTDCDSPKPSLDTFPCPHYTGGDAAASSLNGFTHSSMSPLKRDCFTQVTLTGGTVTSAVVHSGKESYTCPERDLAFTRLLSDSAVGKADLVKYPYAMEPTPPSNSDVSTSQSNRSAQQGEGNRTQQLGLAEASHTCLGSWGWKTQPRLLGSVGTVRHVQNKYIMRDLTTWHESDVSQACVGVVELLALQKTKGARNVAARCKGDARGSTSPFNRSAIPLNRSLQDVCMLPEDVEKNLKTLKICLSPLIKEYIRRLRYCDYLGKYFCDCCHSYAQSSIPARILSKWDFKKYYVCNFSKHLLDSIWQHPIFNVSSINKALYTKSKEMNRVREVQEQLFHLKKLLKTCRFAESVLKEFEQVPSHLTEELHLFSLDDLVKIKRGQLLPLLKDILKSSTSHVDGCEKLLKVTCSAYKVRETVGESKSLNLSESVILCHYLVTPCYVT
ncbi:hypothetical protein IHE44_0005364 [Lamprotornis superbus]|uniref:Rubicon Homology domain-containing protein n=1 Tax=Lamprotornis superbus TaxID=245042 RepID=A0A835NKR4_9PASS|nr:hypothetical protein IHE44_0005364 [Lamprotornis superbus]